MKETIHLYIYICFLKGFVEVTYTEGNILFTQQYDFIFFPFKKQNLYFTG